jgi:hypothetical protein
MITKIIVIWTPQLDERLRELHGQALPFRQIADTMNADFGLSLTRNACIGRGRRIGLNPRASPILRSKPYKRRSHKRKKVTVQTPVISIDLHCAPPIAPGALTMLELGTNTCRWPSGTRVPYSFCGEPVHGDRPYCQKHCKMSYQRPEKTWT